MKRILTFYEWSLLNEMFVLWNLQQKYYLKSIRKEKSESVNTQCVKKVLDFTSIVNGLLNDAKYKKDSRKYRPRHFFYKCFLSMVTTSFYVQKILRQWQYKRVINTYIEKNMFLRIPIKNV